MGGLGHDGWYGQFGGAYVAPPLVPVVRSIGEAFVASVDDPAFQSELRALRATFGGRPTPLHALRRFASDRGGRIFVKREDLAYTGGNYINSAAGQCLLAVRMGARAVVCDTGSGHNGVATAASAAVLGLDCMVFMGRADFTAQSVMVGRMEMLGATVCPVDSGSALLSEAVSSAYQTWIGGAPDIFYVAGAPVGPAPYPAMVHAFQQVIGEELREQALAKCRRLPDALLATLGGGGSLIGLFAAFIDLPDTRLIAVQSTQGAPHKMQVRLGEARTGILHGARTLVLQDLSGAITPPAGHAPGLRYPGTSPEIAHLWTNGRVESAEVSEAHALDIQREVARTEGLLVSIESSHALGAARAIAEAMPREQVVVVSINADNDSDPKSDAISHAS